MSDNIHKRLLRLITAACAGVMLAALPTLPARAADPTESGIQLGMRYWANWGKTSKDLYGLTRATLNSRLTYGSLSGHAGEIFGHASNDGFFVKGFTGLGTLGGGNLQDEDFPPTTAPYSSTNSPQHNGSIGYATIDVGHYFTESPTARIGGLIGYNYFNEKLNAYGCTQTAGSTICVPTISASTKVITQKNNWHSLRLGVNGEARTGALKLSGEAVALPLVVLSGTDTHWLRVCSTAGCFTGPIPEDGTGWGYQLQTNIDYQATPDFSIGIGARYWHMQTKGHTHFEGRVVGSNSIAQPLDWKTNIFGVTAQAALRF